MTRKVIMGMLIVLLLSFVSSAWAGSPCPPRENIYPCSCLALPQGKRLLFTSITCHRLANTDAFNSIFPSLRTMSIDHFYLYDSFWEGGKSEANSEDQQVLPSDWLTMLKIKEIEIVDTTLSQCFACNNKVTCRNDVTTRFTAVNSSSHEKICTLCDNRSGQKFSWTGCMKRLREFHFRHGKLSVIRPDLFPLPMPQLTDLDLSHNAITKIENKAFEKIPNLKVLKLSHNALESLAGISSSKMDQLQELDVSYNMLSSLIPNFFSNFPIIKNLVLNDNYIINLSEKEWANPPKSLRTIDIRENALHCDCSIRWVNGTFHINTVILGHCATPETFADSLVRRASIALIQRCTEDGQIGTRKRTTKPAPTKAMHES